MRITCCLGAAVVVLAASAARAEDAKPAVTWKKTVIDRKFRSEGVAIADVNRDGKTDVLTGEWWFEAPDWKPHAIRKAPEDYTQGERNVYSQSFCCWIEDYNKDGWPDMLVIRFPGQACFWYENPKGGTGHWKEHLVADNACNETPQYADLFGTGQRVLIMGIQPKGKGNNNEGQMAWFRPGADPTQPWEMHPISEPSDPGKKKIVPGTFKFSHGLGLGDMNGDGRKDVICADAWWEQPAKDTGEPWKMHLISLVEEPKGGFPFGRASADIFPFDVDGDGKVDLLSSSAHKFGLWQDLQRTQGSSATFVRKHLLPQSPQFVSETHAMHFVDINGDGLKDLVTGKRWWSHGNRGEPGANMPAMIYWLEAKKHQDGSTTFTPHVIDNDSGIGTQFVVADFNGDGLLDVVVSNKKGTHVIEQVRQNK